VPIDGVRHIIGGDVGVERLDVARDEPDKTVVLRGWWEVELVELNEESRGVLKDGRLV